MKVHLTRTIYHGALPITAVDVRMPGPAIDLERPPRNVNHLFWHIAQITSLPVNVTAQLCAPDAEAILDAFDAVLASVRQAARIISGAYRNV